MVLARIGLGPLRRVRPDVVIDTQNGIPFLARLAYGRRVVVLVHHCHREQWPVAGRWTGRFGWFVESRLSPWLHRRNQYVTVSLPSARDLTDLGVDPDRIAVVRNGLDEAPPDTLTLPRVGPRRASPCCPGWCRTSRSRTRSTPSPQLRPRMPGPAPRRRRRRLVGRAPRRARAQLGIADAVTFHGHVDDATKHEVLQRSWVHVLPSRKEGWGLAVTEAAQHGVPTIGYRSSGGLTDSIVDGVTGLLVDDHDGLVVGLERLLTDPVLREQLGVKAQVRSGEFSWRQSADADAHGPGVGARRAGRSAASSAPSRDLSARRRRIRSAAVPGR